MLCAFGPIEGPIINPVRKLIVYGDSLSDNNTTGDCDWCAPAINAGAVVWSAAAGGARLYNDAADCVSAGTCDLFIEEQVVRNATTTDCEVGTVGSPAGGSTANPIYGSAQTETCLEDLNVGPADVAVIFGGTNDINRIVHSAWDSTYFALSKAAIQRILGAINDTGSACVIVIPPDVLEDQDDVGAEPYTETAQNLDDLEAYLQDGVKTDMGGNYPAQCVVYNARQALLSYEQTHGEAALLALYSDCPAKGSPASTTDCVHFGTTAYQMFGSGILRAAAIAIEVNTP